MKIDTMLKPCVLGKVESYTIPTVSNRSSRENLPNTQNGFLCYTFFRFHLPSLKYVA